MSLPYQARAALANAAPPDGCPRARLPDVRGRGCRSTVQRPAMKVLINAFWLSFCRLAADLLSFVLFAVIARSFGPAGTGQYSYGFAVGTLIALIATSGFEDYGIRQYARASAHERGRLWEDLLTTQCLQLALGAVAFLVFVLLGAIDARNVIVVLELVIYVLGWWLSRTFFIPAMASQSMIKPALTDLGCRVTAILTALLLGVLAHAPLPLMLAGFPLAGVTLLLLSLSSASQHGARLRPGQDWRRVLSTVRGTLPFAGSDLLNQFYARADVLLIAYFLGDAGVGLYATNIKFVEVGLLPLILLGLAAYPLLSEYAARDQVAFTHAARDFTRLLLLLSGWLAVGIGYLVPLLFVPLFGASFAPAVQLLPWVALFALTKGLEATCYRLLYSAHRQMRYCMSLLLGTLLIIGLNVVLIPVLGLKGAICAAILATIAIDSLALAGLWRDLGGRFFLVSLARLGLALGVTAASVAALRKLEVNPWNVAFAACGAFPLLAAALGLVPDPRRSQLLRHPETSHTAASP
jgi:O-antigen/teichoic acid export membrane protein